MIITISRQFGAAGVPIGRRLAEQLGAEFLDRAIVARAAVSSGIAEDELELYDERLPSFWQRITAALAASAPDVAMPSLPYDDLPHMAPHERLMTVVRGVIEDAAARGNAVIVGRGGAFILGRRPGVLNVQLHASLAERIRYLRTYVDEAAGHRFEGSIEEVCRTVDGARAEFIRRTFGVDWMDARHYDLSLDTGRLGVERCVELIAAAAQQPLAGGGAIDDDRRRG
jgi:CMP/dCMP kinase